MNQREKNQGAIDLLEQWIKEAEKATPEEIAAERESFDAVMAYLRGQRAEAGAPDAKALVQRWYDLYGGSTMEIREKYPEDKYAQGEMATLDKDTEQFLGIESQYQRTDMNPPRSEG